MTELQEIEFGLLQQFLPICEQLNLTYYLVCGSALGAAKYSGFIPWDDDIDVALPRKDYKIFCREAPKILPEWCFLQNYHSEPQYYLLGSKLRDSRTTYIEMMTDCLKINQGVFIDIFPLDGQWCTEREHQMFRKKRAIFEAARRVRLNYNRLSPQNLGMVRTNWYWLLFRLFGYKHDTAAEIAVFDRFISSFSTDDSAVWCNHANSTSPLEYAPKEQYGDGIWMKFEGIPVRVPAQYDAYLTQKYGDWRGGIPPDQQYGHHHYVKCDLHRPFTEYIDTGEKGVKKS